MAHWGGVLIIVGSLLAPLTAVANELNPYSSSVAPSPKQPKAQGAFSPSEGTGAGSVPRANAARAPTTKSDLGADYRIGALDVLSIEAQRVTEPQPQLRMIVGASLFVDQVLEDLLPHRQFGRIRMRRAQPRGECLYPVVVLLRVFLQLRSRELSHRPRLVEGMVEQAAVGDEFMNPIDDLRHSAKPPGP